MTLPAMIPHALVPFGNAPGDARFRLTAMARRREGWLDFRYDLRGPLAELVVPPPVTAPERRDGLWQGTCFEAFLARPDAEGYHELNLSSAGHWNLYRLDGYRRGLRPEPAQTVLPFQLLGEADHLALAFSLDLGPLQLAETPVELGLTTVLEHGDGRCSYWALSHTGAEADFHTRQSWRLRF